MNRDASIRAIKAAVSGETYHGNVTAIVENKGRIYPYNNVYASVSYNVCYMQMDVSLVWDDDSKQVNYKKLGLHMGYNSNFQEFTCDDGNLQWKDGENIITVSFE